MGVHKDLTLEVYSDVIFTKTVLESKSMREVGRKLNCDVRLVSKRIKELKLDIYHFINSTQRGKTKYIKYINTTINFLYIKQIYQNKTRSFRNYFALCDCTKCGKENCEILIRSILNNFTKSCGCLKEDSYLRDANSPNWTGCGELRGTMWKHIRSGAKTRNIELSINIEYAWDLFLKQERKCALSGLDLVMGKHNIRPTASLDRIDSSKGYIEGNVQWIHKDINRMKSNFDQSYFIQMCELITKSQ